MNTVAHILVASAALGRKQAPKRNWVIFAGALLPDFSIFVFFGWSRLMGWSGSETWNVRYWTEPWQTLGAISNSFVLAGIILAIALWRKWHLLAVGCGAVLLHLLLDLPLHADDAHRHFWPVTDWRFFSPVSYWDPRANGLVGASFETIFVLICAIVLWRRFEAVWVRATICLLSALQLVMLIAGFVFSDRLVSDDTPVLDPAIAQIEKPRHAERITGPLLIWQRALIQQPLSFHQR